MNTIDTSKAEASEMKIFIVEDSPPVLERLQDMIRDIEDLELVGSAASYDAAVAGIIATRPDVSIFDIKLADDSGSGIDVLVRVRKDLPAMKAIVLSNQVTPQHRKASSEAGAEYFLDKSAETGRIPAILVDLKKQLEAD